jgi:hypothetical protein
MLRTFFRKKTFEDAKIQSSDYNNRLILAVNPLKQISKLLALNSLRKMKKKHLQ